MKSLILHCCLLLTILSLSAGDPEFHGSFFAALKEKDPVLRNSLIIDALEMKKTALADRNAIEFLRQQNLKNLLSDGQKFRIIELLESSPGDFALLNLAREVFNREETAFPTELSAAVICSAEKFDISTLSAKDKTLALYLYKYFITKLLNDRQFDYALRICDALFKKYPDDPEFFHLAQTTTVRACFLMHYTAPVIHNYSALPPDNIFRKRLDKLNESISSLAVKNDREAVLVIAAANALKFPGTPELLKKYSALYPDANWSVFSFGTAMIFKDSTLYIRARDDYYNFLMLVRLKNLRAAKKLISKLPEKLQPECQITIHAAAGRHDKVLDLIKSGSIDINHIMIATFNAILDSAHRAKDTNTVKTFMDMVIKKNIRDPQVCNSSGYVAADLNIKLPEAEKLINIAISQLPDEPSLLDSLAWICLRQGKFSEAEKHIMRALKHCNADTSISVMLLHAAEIKIALKKYDEARKFLDSAKFLNDPEAPAVEFTPETVTRLENILK